MEKLRGKRSLREVAQSSGLSHAYIRDLELERNRSTNDKIQPSPATLKKLAAAYNYSYTELLVRAGYLEETVAVGDSFDFELDDMLYVEVGKREVIYHSAQQAYAHSIESLVDFSDMLETLADKGFKKVDSNVFVNFNQVRRYIAKEGKVYFDPQCKGKSVAIPALVQLKYRRLLENISASGGVTSESLASFGEGTPALEH
ncbi:helix-turn-helix domain-containing protein [Paenibacillus athensensis]|uniref:helix-turn-helix domain-containing protein n=1 Tax=Paenibacillus athensensis TaxID=1967502 RepID=UPI001E501BE1|nr:helix-turn-helix transcriptional regulator [Paenibacillus athensensis]